MKAKITKVLPYLFVLYPTMIVLIFSIYPLMDVIYNSFHDWNMISPTKEFIGLRNYNEILSDPEFIQVILNTLYYTFWSVTLTLLVSTLLAFYLRKNTFTNRLMQTVIFTPFIVSLASISLIWLWLMNNDLGLLNYLLQSLGFQPLDWLGSPKIALNSLILISVWKSVGYNTLIIIGALQNIPSELYEAASLDQSSSWTTFKRITLPMISPTMMFLVITNSIGSVKVFDIVSILTQGGPKNSTKTLVYSLYQNAFEFYKAGKASALGVILFLILTVLTIIYFIFFSRRVHYR